MSSSSSPEHYNLKCLQCEATGQAVLSWTDYDRPSVYSPDNWGIEVSDDFECVPVSHPRRWMNYLLARTICGGAVEQTRTDTPVSRTAMRCVAGSERHLQPEHSPTDFAERQKLRARAFAAGLEQGRRRTSLIDLD